MTAQLAALQSELQVVKAQHQKLRMRDFGKMFDKDDLEYDAEEQKRQEPPQQLPPHLPHRPCQRLSS